jgi:hypothetical protein
VKEDQAAVVIVFMVVSEQKNVAKIQSRWRYSGKKAWNFEPAINTRSDRYPLRCADGLAREQAI